MTQAPLVIEEMTMGEFEEGLSTTRTMLIPFGSVEEHGPHLPLSTDTIQAYEVGKKAACRVPLFVAPPLHYGNCRSTSCHPGTISITTDTLKNILKDIIRSSYRQGIRNFIVLTGHAGGAHCMALQDAGEEIIQDIVDIRVAVLVEFELAREGGKDFIETKDDRHAGEIETSRIMHTHPTLVRGLGNEEYPNFPGFFLVRDKRKFWPNGIWGNPRNASAQKGKRMEESVVTRIVKVVKEMEKHE